MTEEIKTKVFRVVPNGPANMTVHIPLCYFHQLQKQYVWLNQYDEVKSGKEVPKDAQVKMLTLDKNNEGYVLRYESGDPDQEKNEKIIKFFKEWPEVGQAKPNGTVNSFPSDNHQRHFSVFYKSAPNEALPPSTQRLRYVDEDEQTKLSASDKRKKIRISTAMHALAGDDKKLEQVLYMLGISPYGVDTDGKFNLLYDAVHEGDKGGRFLEIVEDKQWDNRMNLAVSTALTLGIISVNDNGTYEFLGNPITKKEKELAFYFSNHKHAFIELIHELSTKGQDFSDLEYTEDGVVSREAEAPKRGRKANNPVSEGENA